MNRKTKVIIATAGIFAFLAVLITNREPRPPATDSVVTVTAPTRSATVARQRPATQARSRAQLVRAALSYLDEVSEVAWYDVAENDVYVGFAPLPLDWEGVIRGVALRCNRAIDFGCHVWALAADQRGWRPGSGSYYGEATARYGRIEN